MNISNNGDLIKRILETREWWKETTPHNSVFNFKWLATSNQIKFERLKNNVNSPKQCVNYFEGHREITTKSGLIKNLKIFCETNK